MATPVDSSFSSQSDDFENLNDSEMNESLIYCLDGNEPDFLTSENLYKSMSTNDLDSPIQLDYIYDENGDSKNANQQNDSVGSRCRKRHTNADENINNEYAKISNSNVKKKIIHLDETAL